MRSEHFAALIVAQIRLGDRNAADVTIRDLLAVDDGLIPGTTALQHAALELVELGFLQDALQIAMRLDDRLGPDVVFIRHEDPATLYAALIAKDPSLASQLMTDTLSTRLHFRLSLDLAGALQAKGETARARAVLWSLADEHQTRDAADADFDGDPICALTAIALAQDGLGFLEDSDLTRYRGLALTYATTDPAARAGGMIALGSSFVSNRAVNSISHGLRCLAYP